MFTGVLDNPPASIAALAGMICMVGWPLAKTRRSMLLIQIGIGVGFGLHYALLGILTAAAVNALGAIQILVALYFRERSDCPWVSRMMIVAVVGSAFLTWQGLPTLVAAAGTLLIAIGRAQSSRFRMRALCLAGLPFWILHDFVVSSIVIIADLASLLCGAILLIRHLPPMGAMRRHGSTDQRISDLAGLRPGRRQTTNSDD